MLLRIASNFYYYFINWHKSVEYRVEKWRKFDFEGEKSGEHQLKKVGNRELSPIL